MRARLFVTTAVLVLALASAATAQIVGIGTNPQGTLFYSIGTTIAKIVTEKGGLTARVQPVGGTSQWLPQLDAGEMEFGVLSGVDAYDGFNGSGSYPGKPIQNLRIAGALGPMLFSFFVRGESPVKTVTDTKGMRLPTEFPATLAVTRSMEALMGAHGLGWSDYQAQPVANLQQAANEFRLGRVDIGVLPIGAGVLQELNAQVKGGIRYLPMDSSPEALARLQRVLPVAYRTIARPSPANIGVIEPIPVMAFDAFFAASAKLGDEIVYKAVAAVHQNKDELTQSFPWFRGMVPERLAKTTPLPYHPGAIKYYTEKGLWPPTE